MHVFCVNGKQGYVHDGSSITDFAGEVKEKAKYKTAKDYSEDFKGESISIEQQMRFYYFSANFY